MKNTADARLAVMKAQTNNVCNKNNVNKVFQEAM